MQVYDIRNNKEAVLSFQAHLGPALCLDHHPMDSNLLATGGSRDNKIKGSSQHPPLSTSSSLLRDSGVPCCPPLVRRYSAPKLLDAVERASAGSSSSAAPPGLVEPSTSLTAVLLSSTNPAIRAQPCVSDPLFLSLSSQPQAPAIKQTRSAPMIHLSAASLPSSALPAEPPMPPPWLLGSLGAESKASPGSSEKALSDADVVHILASSYRTCGASAGELCAHNATAASRVGATQLSHTWLALHFGLVEKPTAEEDKPSDLPCKSESDFSVASRVPSMTPPTQSSSVLGRMATRSLSYSTQLVQPQPSQDLLCFAEGASPLPKLDGESMFASTFVQSPQAAELEPEEMLQPSCLMISGAAFHPPPADQHFDPIVLLKPVVHALLEYHAGHGDVLYPVAPDLIPHDRRHRWIMSYIELLQRLQLFELANAVIKSSDIEKISAMNTLSTSINQQVA
ncbi:MAG: hypothetical protein SGPRY_002780 [Prymnesium sp.]